MSQRSEIHAHSPGSCSTHLVLPNQVHRLLAKLPIPLPLPRIFDHLQVHDPDNEFPPLVRRLGSGGLDIAIIDGEDWGMNFT